MLPPFRLFPPLQAFRGSPPRGSLLQGHGRSQDSPLFRIPPVRAPSTPFFLCLQAATGPQVSVWPLSTVPIPGDPELSRPIRLPREGPQNQSHTSAPQPAMGSGPPCSSGPAAEAAVPEAGRCRPSTGVIPRRPPRFCRHWDRRPKETPPGASTVSPQEAFAVPLWNPARTKHSPKPLERKQNRDPPQDIWGELEISPPHTHTTKSQGHCPSPLPQISGASSPSLVTCGMSG